MHRTILVSGLLLVSGLCSLLFQTAWFREFRLIFGASTLASSAVLAVFMGGLGFGNAVLGRRADGAASPLRYYAVLELLISLSCALSPFLLTALRAGYLASGGQESLGLVMATGVRLLGTIFVIGLPTFLMGGTLAAAVRAVTASEDQQRGSVGVLYGVNTIGAVLGCLLGTFLLFEWLGTRQTLWLACAINLSNALVALAIAKYISWPTTAVSQVPSSQKTVPQAVTPALRTTESATPHALLYLMSGLVGAVFFLMEMVWYRMLGPLLGGSTFTFGLILAVALSGIGLGGTAFSWWYRERRVSVVSFAATLAAEAAALAIPFALGDVIAVLTLNLQWLAIYGFWGQVAGWWLITMLVVFPASFLAGFQFPVLIALAGKGTEKVGQQLGLIYAWNTAGAILGSLVGGFGLMTLLSAPGVWRLSVVLLVLSAAGLLIAVWWTVRRPPAKLVGFIAVFAVVIACVTATGPTALWRHGGIGAGRASIPNWTQNDARDWRNSLRRFVLWEADGRESAVAIMENDSLAFFVNGKSDGNALNDLATQVMLGMIGAIQHPDPQQALVIGLGTGESAGWLSKVPSIKQVEVVELEPSVVEMARRCAPINHNVLERDQVRLVINDAREHLLTTKMRYDLICSEPSNPYRSGISSLYTLEFYQAAAERLAENGIFCQWLQAYDVDNRTVQTVLATLREVFPFVEIWQTQPGDLVLTASKTAKAYDLALIRAKLEHPAYASATSTAWNTVMPEGVMSHMLGNYLFVNRICAQDIQLNTDDRNSLEFGFARTLGRRRVFNESDMLSKAIAVGERWPNALQGTLNESRVNDLKVANDVLNGDGAGMIEPASDRALIWQFIDSEQYQVAIDLWRKQPDAADMKALDVAEMTLLGIAMAKTKDSQLPALLKQLSTWQPGYAQGVSTILAIEQPDPKLAAEQLATFFLHLRRDAIVPQVLALSALVAAESLVNKHPETAAILYDSLRQTFSLHRFQAQRYNTLLATARPLGPQAVCDVVEDMEPFVPWRRSFLELRFNAYQAMNHPLANTALQDLTAFAAADSDRPLLEGVDQ